LSILIAAGLFGPSAHVLRSPASLTAATVNPVANTAVINTVEDTSIGTTPNGFTYTGAWASCSKCQPSTPNASYYSTSASGAAMTLRFNGTQASLYGIRSRNGGISTVSVDGQAAAKVDTYASTAAVAQIFATAVLTPGSHTLVLTDTHTHNAKSTGYALAIDRAAVTAGPNAVLYGKVGAFGNLGSALPTGESWPRMLSPIGDLPPVSLSSSRRWRRRARSSWDPILRRTTRSTRPRPACRSAY
jgi:hypothetical protein